MCEFIETLTNDAAESIEVWFEPWGMTHPLVPGQSFQIVCISERQGNIEIERENGRAIVYASPRSTLQVYCGEHLIDEFLTMFPDLPNGMSTKSMIKLFFRGADCE